MHGILGMPRDSSPGQALGVARPDGTRSPALTDGHPLRAGTGALNIR
jgi:hypothetical protein